MSLKGKLTLLKRWCGIVTGKNRVAIHQGIGRYYSKSEVAGYYNDLTGKVNDQTLLDKNGITVNLVEGNKQVYFPISIFQYALGLFDFYLESNDESFKERFFTQCEWILDNQAEDGSWDCFTPIGYSEYSVSSMGQGEAVSVLLRAYCLTKDNKWLTAAKKAVKFMIIPLKNGGTLRIDGDDYFLEEYPDKEGSKKSVLNGWIFSLFGLCDYLKIEKDSEIEEIYIKSLKTLKKNLSRYDTGYWTYYDLSGRIASPAYHELHIALLLALSDITEESYFENIAAKWSIYQKKKYNRSKAILKKALQKMKEKPEGIIIK